jgi:hypothetical protein
MVSPKLILLAKSARSPKPAARRPRIHPILPKTEPISRLEEFANSIRCCRNPNFTSTISSPITVEEYDAGRDAAIGAGGLTPGSTRPSSLRAVTGNSANTDLRRGTPASVFRGNSRPIRRRARKLSSLY